MTTITSLTQLDLDGGQLVVFTRYLYIRTEVEHSLLNSILKQDKEQALFWGFELYHSSEPTDLLALLSKIYDTYYASYVNLGKFLNKKCNEFADINESIQEDQTTNQMIDNQMIDNQMIDKERIIGTIINNLTIKKYIYTGKDRKLFIIPEEKDILKYRTIDNATVRQRFYLKTVCLYQPFREPIQLENFEQVEPIQYLNIQEKYYDHWLYYASFSQIWAKRIIKYKGIINHATRYIEFKNDDFFEDFYELYSYEPDEQSIEVQIKNIPIKDKYNYKFPILL